jgi:hypothetical protein
MLLEEFNGLSRVPACSLQSSNALKEIISEDVAVGFCPCFVSLFYAVERSCVRWTQISTCLFNRFPAYETTQGAHKEACQELLRFTLSLKRSSAVGSNWA